MTVWLPEPPDAIVLAIFDGAVRRCDARIVTNTNGDRLVHVSAVWSDRRGTGTSANGMFTFNERGVRWAYDDNGEEAQAFHAMVALR